MTAVKIWNGSAWVDSDTPESVWNGSAWVDLGPAGGAADEKLTWPGAPTDLDLNDGVTYNMGLKFHLVAAKPILGVQWERVPDTTPAPPLPGGAAAYVASLWNLDTTTRLDFINFTPVPGSSQRILFTTPTSGSTGVNYAACIFTAHYVFRSSAGQFPLTSPSGNVVADEARLATSTNPNTTPGSASGLFYVSPIVEV